MVNNTKSVKDRTPSHVGWVERHQLSPKSTTDRDHTRIRAIIKDVQ